MKHKSTFVWCVCTAVLVFLWFTPVSGQNIQLPLCVGRGNVSLSVTSALASASYMYNAGWEEHALIHLDAARNHANHALQALDQQGIDQNSMYHEIARQVIKYCDEMEPKIKAKKKVN